MNAIDIEKMMEGGRVYPIGCHDDLNLVCCQCQTYPLHWSSRDWYCRTRGAPVSADTHACTECVKRVPPIDPLDAILPEHFNWRRRKRQPRLPEPPHALPADLRLHEGGVVYFVDCAGFTKVGFTAGRIAGRLQGLQAGTPLPVILWGLVRGSVTTEHRFHAKLRRHHHHYEWFRLPHRIRRTLEGLLTDNGGQVYDEEPRQ